MTRKRNMAANEHKTDNEGNACGDADAFDIREFLDPRKLTRIKLKPSDAPPSGTPYDVLRHEYEDEFDLRRSTPEEAEQFLRAVLDASDCGNDELVEFLDDD